MKKHSRRRRRRRRRRRHEYLDLVRELRMFWILRRFLGSWWDLLSLRFQCETISQRLSKKLSKKKKKKKKKKTQVLGPCQITKKAVNTKKSCWKLRRLAVTQTPVKDHRLTEKLTKSKIIINWVNRRKKKGPKPFWAQNS